VAAATAAAVAGSMVVAAADFTAAVVAGSMAVAAVLDFTAVADSQEAHARPVVVHLPADRIAAVDRIVPLHPATRAVVHVPAVITVRGPAPIRIDPQREVRVAPRK
jgi:hypothetical protein